MRISAVLLAVSVMPPFVSAAETISVTSCGTTVPAGATGVLAADLECSVQDETPVLLERNAMLDLAGHSITYVGPSSAYDLVACLSRCKIVGPGSLLGGPGSPINGIHVATNAKISVRDLTLAVEGYGLHAYNGVARISNSTVQSRDIGLNGAKKFILDQVTVSVSGDSECINGSERSEDSSASSVRGRDVTLGPCRVGILATRSISVDRLTVSGLSYAGVFSDGRLRLRDSSVTGSGAYDVVSRYPPKLANTLCDRSAMGTLEGGTGTTWGVCAND